MSRILQQNAQMRFTESSFHSWSLYSIIDYIRHSLYRQVCHMER